MTIALSFPATTTHQYRWLSPSENQSAAAPMLKSSLAVPLPLSSRRRVELHHFLVNIGRQSHPGVRCDVALKSTASIDAGPSSSGAESEFEAEVARGKAKIGTKVRVTAPLKVYHVIRVPEVDLLGMEGVLKDYVGVWKGKPISANLPYKIEFLMEIEGRRTVKFFAHLKEDEFEFLE